MTEASLTRLARWLIAAFVVALWSASLLTVSALGDWPHDAVCRISCGEYGASGTMMGVAEKRAVVVSCAHLFDDGAPRNDITVYFENGFKSRGRLIDIDFRNDLSAIDIARPEGIESPNGYAVARDGEDPFTLVGYPWYTQGEQEFRTAEYMGYSGSEVDFTTLSESGYSGGALFNKHGALCGVVLGNRGPPSPPGVQVQMDRGRAASGPALMRFLDRWIK